MLSSTTLIIFGIPAGIAALAIMDLWRTRNDGAVELALEEAKVNFVAMARSENHQALQHARKGMQIAYRHSLNTRDILVEKARWAETELQKVMSKRTTP